MNTLLGSARRIRTSMASEHRILTYAMVSTLLRYPDDLLVSDLGSFRSAIGPLPAAAGLPLHRLIDHLARTPLRSLQEGYVATFDLQRRCCLYLSYYTDGDTRRRGTALWHFQDAYRRAGLQPNSAELPDFLPMVLEMAATGGERVALDLLRQHRAGIGLLHSALDEIGSPYAHALQSLEAVLPPPPASIAENVLHLAMSGPPAELVGLDALAPPAPAAPAPEMSEGACPAPPAAPAPEMSEGACP